MRNYNEDLRDPRWQKKRLEIMKRANWGCEVCNNDKINLQIHHKEYIRGLKPWEYQDNLLICLCEDCHRAISNKNTDNEISPERQTLSVMSVEESVKELEYSAEKDRNRINNILESTKRCEKWLKDPLLPEKLKKDMTERIKCNERIIERIKILREIQKAEISNDFDKASLLSQEFNKLLTPTPN